METSPYEKALKGAREVEADTQRAIDEALRAVRSHQAPTRETSHATWQDDRGMNERVTQLRHVSATTQPYIAP